MVMPCITHLLMPPPMSQKRKQPPPPLPPRPYHPKLLKNYPAEARAASMLRRQAAWPGAREGTLVFACLFRREAERETTSLDGPNFEKLPHGTPRIPKALWACPLSRVFEVVFRPKGKHPLRHIYVVCYKGPHHEEIQTNADLRVLWTHHEPRKPAEGR